MSHKIYKLFMMKFTPAWYDLSNAEQDDMIARVGKALESVGGKPIIDCNAVWAAEQVHAWGVEEFPNVEAVQKLAALHAEMNWHRYINSTSILGTKIPGT